MTLAVVTALPSISWFFWQTLICIAAAIGGVFVFIGLGIEGSPAGEKEKRGWRVLRFGILIEIVVSVFFAANSGWEIWKINGEQAKNNPLNQPVSDISARASIEVKGTNFDEIDPKPHFRSFGAGWVSAMGLNRSATHKMDTGTALGSSLLASTWYLPSLSGSPTPDHRAYFLRFDNLMSSQSRRVAKDIETIDFLKIAVFFLPTNSEILGGNVTLIINSDVKREYKILPQTQADQSLNPFWPIPSVVMIATNVGGAELYKTP